MNHSWILLCLIYLSLGTQDAIYSKYWPLESTNNQGIVAAYACFPNSENPSEWWLCLANFDSDTLEPVNLRAVVRASLQGAEFFKTISVAIDSSGLAHFLTHSSTDREIFLHSCKDLNCTGTTTRRFYHRDSIAFYPRLTLDQNQNPLLSVLKVTSDHEASINLIRCSDASCRTHTATILFDDFLPEWSPNRLISFEFELDHRGAPQFVVAYNSTIWTFQCETQECKNSTINEMVQSTLISDLSLSKGIIVAALQLDSLFISKIGEPQTNIIPTAAFESISVKVSHLASGMMKITTSRWDPVLGTGILQYIHCNDPICSNFTQTDIDQFPLDSGWAPSVTLTEGKPDQTVILYFKFEELALYSQVCSNSSGSSCSPHILHNGHNITMNSDQEIPNSFWEANWPWFIFGASGLVVVLLVVFVKRTVNAVKRVEYSDIQSDQKIVVEYY